MVGKHGLPSKFAFRLIYNGESVVQRMKSCSGFSDLDICDIQVLLDRVRPFAVRQNPDCFQTDSSNRSGDAFKPSSSIVQQSSVVGSALAILDTKHGLSLFVMVLAFATFLGMLAGMQHTRRRFHRHQILPQHNDRSDD